LYKNKNDDKALIIVMVLNISLVLKVILILLLYTRWWIKSILRSLQTKKRIYTS